jgi:diketogulonate reductase-like aldo/keto reductase
MTTAVPNVTLNNGVEKVVLRWMVQREVVVIPKSVRRERMAQNIDTSTSRSPTTRCSGSSRSTAASRSSSTHRTADSADSAERFAGIDVG